MNTEEFIHTIAELEDAAKAVGSAKILSSKIQWGMTAREAKSQLIVACVPALEAYNRMVDRYRLLRKSMEEYKKTIDAMTQLGETASVQLWQEKYDEAYEETSLITYFWAGHLPMEKVSET